ncbi:MAG: NADH-quinone oxidoreductase subunit NuoG [Acidobacteria bacterium]|nr:NADH-quinone oxidoreductase subunit NuoG [Acidobacteriota bacterium]
MADSVNITVDGRSLQVRPGTLLIEACRAAGIEVPSFCYYPGLSLQAACRMCLVEIEKAPKLQTSCTVPVAEGMVVRTATPPVVEARRSMLEFLLGNHPLDCPVCDKGGECELQDMVFRYGAAESRFAEEKRHIPEQQWSPVVYFDAPRCILCYRCVRVCGEGLDVHALGIVNRGGHSENAPNHGDHLECEECGMCIDICPVGALTSGAYRYKARPWEINYVSTICTHCGDGCKTTLSVRNNTILRGNNRDHSGINGEFLCIKGRYAYDFIEHPERLRHPLVRKTGQLVETSWEEAIRMVASRWKEIPDHQNESASSPAFGVIGSNHTTNEDNYALQKFARVILGTNNIDHHRTADFPALIAALSAQQHAAAGVPDGPACLARSRDLAHAAAILLIGNNPTVQHPLIAWNIREGCRLRGTRLYVIHSQQIPLLRQSFRFLPLRAGQEVDALAYLAGELGREEKLLGRTPGGREITSESLLDFRNRLLAEKDVIVVFGDEITGQAVSLLVRMGSQLPGHTRYLGLSDYSNSRGAADMGLLPHLLPGYCAITDPLARSRFEEQWKSKLLAQPGWTAEEMLAAIRDGRLGSLYVVGANPLKKQDPLEYRGKTFLVVQDLFLHETAQAADVVLPAACAYEKTGTVTNTCGELQRLRKAMQVLGPRSDLEIFGHLAKAMDAQLQPSRPDEVFEEIRQLVSGYNVPLSQLMAGEAELAMPINGFLSPSEFPGNVSSSQDHLFTSGTLGRYSQTLNIVPEGKTYKPPDPC